jgi:hypothetical protein
LATLQNNETRKELGKSSQYFLDGKFSRGVFHEGNAGPESGQVSGAAEHNSSPHTRRGANILHLLTNTSAEDCCPAEILVKVTKEK